MPLTITGSPLGTFGQAIYQRLAGDMTLAALATGGVYTSMPRSGTVNYPYVVVGSRERGGKGYHGGAMQREGARGLVTVDVWSNLNDPTEAHSMQSRIVALLERYPLNVAPYALIAGSLDCEDEKVFPDVDPELPQQRSLFHGVQMWTAWLEEAA